MKSWTEKYRPKTLDAIAGNDRAVTQLKKWAESWKRGNPNKKAVVLSGKAGTGKTSAALALANDYNWTVIELNTSDARNASKIKKVATSGAVNETFDDQGRFISSKTGGRKLIVLDEADNLYERISSSSSTEKEDLSDKGGKRAIVETIKKTSQPIILIVNDYYQLIKGSGESLKKNCKLIKFYDPYPSAVFNLLRNICSQENIKVDKKVLHTIADRCKGDVRSAINDLQSICINKKQVDIQNLEALGYRDREKIIFDVLREVFKTKNLPSIKESMLNTDTDPNSFILWINENIPKEYKNTHDLVRAYDLLSKADVFLGRTYRRQSFGLWSYANDFMGGGVATAKTRRYPNDRYNFPNWLREMKKSKPNREIRNSLLKKISKNAHISSDKSKEAVLPYFKNMFSSDINFAIKMKEKLDLTENEMKYLLKGESSHKLKEITQSSKFKNQRIDKEKTTTTKKKKQKQKEKKEQQRLF